MIGIVARLKSVVFLGSLLDWSDHLDAVAEDEGDVKTSASSWRSALPIRLSRPWSDLG